MAKHYVTLGQNHKHIINGLNLDENCVVTYEASSHADGRKKAFEYFGDKFFTDYHDTQFDMSKLRFFPHGLVQIDGEQNHTCNEDLDILLLNNGNRVVNNAENRFKYNFIVVGGSVACTICEKAAIDSRNIHDI